MARNSARFFSRTKKFIVSATNVILTLSVFSQTLVVAQSPLGVNNASSRVNFREVENSGFIGPVVEQPSEVTSNNRSLMADCSSQTALRREISNRWRFFAQPIPPFLPGIGIPGINRKARKAYEELYWSARVLEEIGKQLLREARRATDNNQLSSACSILDKELRLHQTITDTDADANNLWYGFLNNTYNSVRRIRDTCMFILGATSSVGGLPLLVLGILNSLFKEMTDNALFQANLPPETYARIIIFDVLIPILLSIQFARLRNQTFSQFVTRNITLPTLVRNPPGFVKLIKEAFRIFRGRLRPELERRINLALAGAITEAQINILVDGLNSRLERYIDESTGSQRPELDSVTENGFLTMLETTPAETATEVNVSVPTLTVRYSEMLQHINIQAQLFHQNGSTVPLNSGVIGDTLFFNLGTSLQPNTSYTMRLQAGSVRGTESNALNQELEWSFVTDTVSLTSGSSALVTNTGGVGLRLRTSPSISAGIIATLSESTRLTVTGNPVQSSGYTWYPVQTQSGQIGWSATGNWLTPVDQYGFRPNGEVRVSNTSGVGLRLRVEASETSPIITVLSEGTIVKLTGEPVFADGYSWFPVQTLDGTQGYSTVARWLIPYNQSGANQLVIRTMAASTTAKLDWGQSTTYVFHVTDGNGLPVSGAFVGGQNNLIGSVFLAPNTSDVNGRTSYTTTVPTGRANGVYSIVASATRSGFSNSLTVTRNVEVSHGCSYQIAATDSTFPSTGGTGSFSIITNPTCSWSVSNQNPGFISLTSSGYGMGDGEVTFNVSPNASTALRTGNLVVGGTNVSVRQLPAPAPTPAPANNNFSNAQTINGSLGGVNGSNVGADKEAGEPNHAGNPGGKSVWYRWQAPVSSSVTFNTAGSNFDTLLAVYTGSSVSALTTIASNDDVGSGDLTSRVTFNAVAGTTYQIAVDGYNAASGNIALNWSIGTTPPPPTTASVQFSAASYSVSEGAGGVVVTVTRTGDLSGTATVDYATSEAFSSPPCETVNGTASARCDYMVGFGTVRFAAGQSQQTITLLITDDTRVEGNEAFPITLSNPSGATLGTPNVVTVTINDNDTNPSAPNSIDGAGFFVRHHYRDFFSREADDSGLGFWAGRITGCGGSAQCTDAERVNTSAAFYISTEFQQTGYLVYRMYRSAFGRQPRFAEFLPDTQAIGRGVVVGQAGWEAQLEANKQALAEAFVQRGSFTAEFAGSLTATEYVDRLFQRAVVTPTAAERQAAIDAFGTGGVAGRARALRAVAENRQLYDREYNPAFVLMQYYGYLRRNPNDLPDTDFAGYNFWLGELNRTRNYSNMVRAFIVSEEYRKRFGRP